jgi:serine/threonine protein kinase
MGGYPRWFGRYLLLEEIGTGGFGSVYFAVATDRDRLIVVKTLRSGLLDSEDARLRFEHEAKVSVQLTSGAFARILEAGTVGDVPYLAMEHVRGRQLRRFLGRMKEDLGARLAIDDTADLATSMLRAVRALHEARSADGVRLEIVHRDLTPANLIVTSDRTVRLIDLGIGRSILADEYTRTGVVVGSPGYFSPEQALGEPLDQKSDQFAAAIIVWEMFAVERLVGRSSVPLIGSVELAYRPLHRLRPAIPAELDAVLRRALERKASRRYGSVGDFLVAIAPVLEGMRGRREDRTVQFEEAFVPDQEEAHLAELLARAVAVSDAPSEEPTVFVSVPPIPVEAARAVSDSMVFDVAPADTAPIARPPRPKKVEWWILPALGVIGGGLYLGMEMGRGGPVDRPPPPPLEGPSVQVTARPVAAGADVEPAPEEPPPIDPSPKERSIRRKSDVDTPPPPPLAPPAVDPAPPDGPSLDELLRRAAALRTRHPERAAELLSDLALEGRRRDPDRLRAIEREIARLEAE